MNKKDILLIALVGVMALFLGQLTRYFLEKPMNNEMIINASLPAFNFVDSAGNMRHSREWTGKIFIINFWATWCFSCREEMAEFIQLQKEYTEKNVQFIGISVEEDKRVIHDYMKSIAINYPILIGGDAAMLLMRQLGNTMQAIPYTLIVNQHGQIIYNEAGELTRDIFNKTVVPLL